jgi:hypothetical protein
MRGKQGRRHPLRTAPRFASGQTHSNADIVAHAEEASQGATHGGTSLVQRREAATNRTVLTCVAVQDAAAAAAPIEAERALVLDAAERKVRAQRALGERLQAAPLDRGGRPSSNRSQNRTGSLTLARLNLSKHQSSFAQRLARMGDSSFEAYLASTRAAGVPATASGALRAARKAAEPPDASVVERAPCTRGLREFSRLLNAARRVARDFDLGEQITALTTTATFARQVDEMFAPRPNMGAGGEEEEIR